MSPRQIAESGVVKVVKSGTDFRFITEVVLDFSKAHASGDRTLPFTVTTVKHEITSGPPLPSSLLVLLLLLLLLL